MDIATWLLAGSIVGWVGFARLGFNEERGMIASVIIGAIGGVLGAKLLAPMFGAAAAPGEFSLAILIVALASAAACLAAANKIHDRFGV